MVSGNGVEEKMWSRRSSRYDEMGCSSIRVFVIKIKKILRVGSEAVCVCTGTHTLYCSEDDAIKNIENKNKKQKFLLNLRVLLEFSSNHFPLFH